MGYSARYHAASLAAIFFALAIGILIGSQVGGDILNRTRDSLEKSLTSDLDDSRARVSELKGQLADSNDFGNSVYPALVSNQIRGDRVGLVGFGELPSSVSSSAENAISASGAKLVAVGTVREPPSPKDLFNAIGSDARLQTGPRLLEKPRAMAGYGDLVGRQLITGGNTLDATQSELFSQSSGKFGGLDGLLIYRGEPEGMTAEETDLTESLEAGMLKGMRTTAAHLVGVQETGTSPSSIGFYIDNNLSSVDNIDQPAGKVSLVYALGGASGNFGISGDSERFLPELLEPATPPRPGGRAGTGGKNSAKQG